ncbi:MAG TPA: hypothetical protein DCS93_03425 [Microscillaceae bacterium]|nr:hypothetical protein [Microscillaceae bacterium]
MQELVKKHWEYILSRDNKGVYIFSVVYSQGHFTGSFDFKLNRIEVSEYLKKGTIYLDDLADHVRDHMDDFKDRFI